VGGQDARRCEPQAAPERPQIASNSSSVSPKKTTDQHKRGASTSTGGDVVGKDQKKGVEQAEKSGARGGKRSLGQRRDLGKVLGGMKQPGAATEENGRDVKGKDGRARRDGGPSKKKAAQKGCFGADLPGRRLSGGEPLSF